MRDGSKTRIRCHSGRVGTFGKKNQKLHSRLHDTILNQYLAIETILEVNEMLLELEEATMNVVDDLNMKMLTQKMMRRRVTNLRIASMKRMLLLSNLRL